MTGNEGRKVSITVVMVLALAVVGGAQTKKSRKSYPIVIYPDYSFLLCRSASVEEKCNEVPSEFIAQFAENKACVGLTLKVLNSTDPQKWPPWWRELQSDQHHPYWLVRVGLFENDPSYIGTATGPDGVSHDVSSYLPNADPAQMREIVVKTCALASGTPRGGKVER
jgi:hypothetical protein